MGQNYKIFIKEVPLILTGEEIDTNSIDGDTYVASINSPNDIKEIIEQVEAHPANSSIILYNSDIGKLFKDFKSFFTTVEAAGGLVWNSLGALLLIYRHDKWDLPKGKIEEDEEPDEAALREVSEECGIQNLTLSNFLTSTYHTFWQQNQRILKVTYWFEMHCDDPENINPQTEEGIETIRWTDANGIRKAMENTFPNLRLLFEECLQRMES